MFFQGLERLKILPKHVVIEDLNEELEEAQREVYQEENNRFKLKKDLEKELKKRPLVFDPTKCKISP